MRTHVIFRYPAEFVPVSDEDGVLSIQGAQWFVPLLRRVPELQIDDDLIQEDWGVEIFAQRESMRFSIGLNMWDLDQHWLAHFHHGMFAWSQRWRASGKRELQRLLSDVHSVLTSDPAVSSILWYEQRELDKPQPTGFPTPNDD